MSRFSRRRGHRGSRRPPDIYGAALFALLVVTSIAGLLWAIDGLLKLAVER